MPKATTSQMSGRLKAMGLGPDSCKKCLETFRESGERQAMQQAREFLDRRDQRLRMARELALAILNKTSPLH